MSNHDQPLKPTDFPLHVEGEKIRKQDGKRVAPMTRHWPPMWPIASTRMKTGESKINGQPNRS
jgi:hypothetical protein